MSKVFLRFVIGLQAQPHIGSEIFPGELRPHNGGMPRLRRVPKGETHLVVVEGAVALGAVAGQGDAVREGRGKCRFRDAPVAKSIR